MEPVGAIPVRPKMQPGIELVLVAEDRALLRSFSGTIMLSGEFVREVLPDLLPKLDGSRSIEALLSDLGADYASEVEDFLRLMERKGLLVAGDDSHDGVGTVDSHARAYWTLHGPGAAAAAAQLSAATVVLGGLGAVGVTVARHLTAAGLGRLVLVDPGSVGEADLDGSYRHDVLGRPHVEVALAAEDRERRTAVSAIAATVDTVQDWERLAADANLVVLCGDAMTMAGYDRTNVACIRSGTPWVSARIDRSHAVLGPFVIPGQTPCFTCFELRARANADHPADHQELYEHWKRSVDAPPDWPSLSPVAGIVGGMLALDVLRVLGGGHLSAVAGRVLYLDLRSFSSRTHEILKLPRCPDCSRLTSRPLARIWDIAPKPAPDEGR